MRKGVSPIVAVVLLIAIAVVAAVGLYFWAGGLATSQNTPETPIAISAVPVGVGADELKLLLANLGDTAIPAGTTFYTSNGAEANLSTTLPAGQQAMLTFHGGTTSSGTVDFGDSNQVAVYSAGSGSSIVHISTDGANVTLPHKVTDCAPAKINCNQPSIMQDMAGTYWIALHNESGQDIMAISSANLSAWNGPYAVFTEYDADRPSMIQGSNGEYYVAFNNYTAGNILGVQSSDPAAGFVSWPNTVIASANPSLIEDGGQRLWIASGGWSPAANNSTDWGVTWNDALQFSTSRFWLDGGWPSMSHLKGDYYCAKWGYGPSWNGISLEKNWGGGGDGPGYKVGSTKIEIHPSLLINQKGEWVVAYDYGGNIHTIGTKDFSTWDGPYLVTSSGTARDPSIMQDSNGKYIIAYTDSGPGADEIYVASSTSWRIWA